MGALTGKGANMSSPRSPIENSKSGLLHAKHMEVTDNPTGLRVTFHVDDEFFRCGRAEKDKAIAAAGAELLTATATTAAGWNASASLISMTLEFLNEALEGPVIGLGSISRMGANIAFVGGQIMAGNQLCSRATGSCRIDNEISHTPPQNNS